MNDRIGIMQGRLLPPVGDRIQAFPGREWRAEFSLAAELGFASLEWIFEAPVEENPLWQKEGLDAIQAAVAETDVAVNFVLADYFMSQPLFRLAGEEVRARQKVLQRLVDAVVAVGARGVEVPFVDGSSIESQRDEDEVCTVLEPCLDYADRQGVVITLELDFPAERARRLYNRLDHPAVRANYDTGNSAALGYDVRDEFDAYGSLITNVHVKDRIRGGGTVPLGEGDTDFATVFEVIRALGYQGDFIIQGARAGDEVEVARRYLDFVLQHLSLATGR